VLSDADKALYARQILLSELGLPGQERLASTAVRIADGADARVSEITSDYLTRAGVGSQPDATDLEARVVNAASASVVSRVAGDPELEGCAAWLLGAFAAVEAIKAAAGVGAPAALDADFVLAREVV
jgi:hypothetical protein